MKTIHLIPSLQCIILTHNYKLRGMQKVCRLAELTTRYAHHILSLFNIVSFLQLKCTWSGVSPKLWCRYRRIVVLCLTASHLPCNTNTNGKYGGWRSSWKPAFWITASALANLWSRCPGSKWLLFVSQTERIHERTQSFWWWGRYLHDKWLARRPRTILLQRNQSFGETLDKVHFSRRRICWKVTKYDVPIS